MRNEKKAPKKALEIIVGYFHRVGHPLYLGFVSLEVGYSLDQTQRMLDELEEAGVVRPLTDDEKRTRKLDVRGVIYTLTEQASPSKATW